MNGLWNINIHVSAVITQTLLFYQSCRYVFVQSVITISQGLMSESVKHTDHCCLLLRKFLIINGWVSWTSCSQANCNPSWKSSCLSKLTSPGGELLQFLPNSDCCNRLATQPWLWRHIPAGSSLQLSRDFKGKPWDRFVYLDKIIKFTLFLVFFVRDPFHEHNKPNRPNGSHYSHMSRFSLRAVTHLANDQLPGI